MPLPEPTMKNQHKGRRVFLTLPPKTYEDLVAIAEADTRPVAQAATAMLIEAIRQRQLEMSMTPKTGSDKAGGA